MRHEKIIVVLPLRRAFSQPKRCQLVDNGRQQGSLIGRSGACSDKAHDDLSTGRFGRRAGLLQWAQVTGVTLAHPSIDIPSNVTFDDKGDSKINIDANTLLGGKDDGSFAWVSYGAIRSTWRRELFANKFPTERTYRHSLAEEADALRSVIKLATADAKVKTLNPSLRKLKQLDDEGLLEAYILLAHADEGIASDHPAYLKVSRDKLRRYMVEYVVTGGGAN